MLHSCAYVEDDDIKLNIAVLWKLSYLCVRKRLECCQLLGLLHWQLIVLGERFLCDLSKILFCAVKGGR